MTTLHRAALKRAYRTLAQGLGGSATATALAALVAAMVGGGTDTALVAAAASIGTTVVAAFTSFWQGVAGGLPEVGDVSDA